MRLLFLDTETTGLSPQNGHRIVELAGVEMLDGRITGQEFHTLVNPQMPVPPEVTRIHGIDDAMLQGQTDFSEVAPEFLKFVGDDPVVMHNAPFDMGFFVTEFDRMGTPFPPSRPGGLIIDTLPRFRKLHSLEPCSLSKLCARYGLEPQAQDQWHSALTDARMLARLWLAAGLIA